MGIIDTSQETVGSWPPGASYEQVRAMTLIGSRIALLACLQLAIGTSALVCRRCKGRSIL